MAKPQLIPYRAHLQWVHGSLLEDPNFLLFLVRPGGCKRAAGLTQLKIDSDCAEIGVMFRQPKDHQAAIAVSTVAMLHLAFERLRLSWLKSYVVNSHLHAIRFNIGFGARKEASDKPGMVKLMLNAQQCLANDLYQRIMQRMQRQGLQVIEP
jgi:hypothetical protein